MSNQQSKQPGSGEVSRRQALRAGAALAGLSTLGARVVAADLPAPAASAPRLDVRPEAKRLIVVFLEGGLSHIDSLDPKPNAPEGVRGAFGTIETAIPGVRLSEHLPELARRLDQVTLVRGIDVGESTHGAAQAAMLSGWPADAKNPAPTYGAVLYSKLGPGPKRLRELERPGCEFPLGVHHCGQPLGSNYIASDSSWIREGDMFRTYGFTMPQLRELMLRRKFKYKTIDAAVRKHLHGQMRVGILSNDAGVRSVSVTTAAQFDDHERIYSSDELCFSKKLRWLDEEIARLIRWASNPESETLLAVLTDFGRDPYINAQGGRHHWPRAGAAILAGAGVPKGVVVGATDRLGGEQVESPIGPGDLGRWILGAFGLRPEPRPRALEEGRLL